jgi:hypothetical protein
MGKHILTREKYVSRNIGKMSSMNNGKRTLKESIMSNEVIDALEEWKYYNKSDCVLIGGVALSYYIKPRYTQDVDFLFLSETDIPDNVDKFKRFRKGAFRNNKTHVEVEVISPETINTNKNTVKAVFDTAKIVDGVKVASPSGLVALKLGRFSYQDMADIQELYKFDLIDLSPYHLSDELIQRYIDFVQEIKNKENKKGTL